MRDGSDRRVDVSRDHRHDGAVEILADMPGGRRPQEAGAERGGRARRRSDDGARQGGMFVVCTDGIECRERADEKVVAGWRQGSRVFGARAYWSGRRGRSRNRDGVTDGHVVTDV